MIPSPDSLRSQYGGPWGNHPTFPPEDWRYEVAGGDTREGYWSWLEDKLRDEESDLEVLPLKDVPLTINDPSISPEGKELLKKRLEKGQ